MFKIKTIILILIFCFGILLISGSGCTLFKGRQISKPKVDVEQTCCQECLEFISSTGEAEKCLDNSKISDQCREFFEKNPDKEESCLDGEIAIPPVGPFPDQDWGTKPGGIFGKCDEPYVWWKDFEEIEKRFKGGKWSGTIIGDSANYTYTIKVKELKMDFDSESLKERIESTKTLKAKGLWSPCLADPTGMLMLVGSPFGGLPLVGSATIEYSVLRNNGGDPKGASEGGAGYWTCHVTNDPISLSLAARIFFTETKFNIGTWYGPAGFYVSWDKVIEQTGDIENLEAGDKDLKVEAICDIDYGNWRQRFIPDWSVNELILDGDFEFLDGKHIVINRGSKNLDLPVLNGTLYFSR